MVLDPERAPLVKMAFEEYATGRWTGEALATHLAALGLTTRATAKIPSRAVDKTVLYRILRNPYYKGIFTYGGVEYMGSHEKLVSPEIWDMVQVIMSSRVTGERERRHHHFLRGSIFCGECGSRLIFSREKNHAGMVYDYFVCGGRQRKKSGCMAHAVTADKIEAAIERIYEKYELSFELRTTLETELQGALARERGKCAAEITLLKNQRAQLELQQEKLLDAFIADFDSSAVVKRKINALTAQIENIDCELRMRDTSFADIERKLTLALDLLEDCGATYKMAPEHVKKLFNQALFDKFLVYTNGDGGDCRVEPIWNELPGRIVEASIKKGTHLDGDCGDGQNDECDFSDALFDTTFFNQVCSSNGLSLEATQAYSNKLRGRKDSSLRSE